MNEELFKLLRDDINMLSDKIKAIDKVLRPVNDILQTH